MSELVLTVKQRGPIYFVAADTEAGQRSWSRSRNLPVTRMKAYLLARRIWQRTGQLVRVTEHLEAA